MSSHALLSPSSAHRWIACPGSLAMEKSFPNSSNKAADYGTACHELGQWALSDSEGRCDRYLGKPTANGHVINREMCDMTQEYVDRVIDYAEGHMLLIEQRVDFSSYVGVADSFGTADAIVITEDGKEIQCHDLKTGYHSVDAEKNAQLMLYALGALHSFSMFGPFERVRLVIHQPSIGNLSEWDCTVAELMVFAQAAKDSAAIAIECLSSKEDRRKRHTAAANLIPGKKQCQWCRARSTCPALACFVRETIECDFDKIVDPKELLPESAILLAQKMTAIPLIEDWCTAVRAEVERQLLAGQAVPGYKLVRGKMGNRSWADESEAEMILRSAELALAQMYKMKLISVAEAEKLLAKKNPPCWGELAKLVTQTEGGLSVAPQSDKRPPVSPLARDDDFDDLTKGEIHDRSKTA